MRHFTMKNQMAHFGRRGPTPAVGTTVRYDCVYEHDNKSNLRAVDEFSNMC